MHVTEAILQLLRQLRRKLAQKQGIDYVCFPQAGVLFSFTSLASSTNN